MTDDSSSSDDSSAAADRQTSELTAGQRDRHQQKQRQQRRLRNRQTRAALAVLIDRQPADESTDDSSSSDDSSDDVPAAPTTATDPRRLPDGTFRPLSHGPHQLPPGRTTLVPYYIPYYKDVSVARWKLLPMMQRAEDAADDIFTGKLWNKSIPPVDRVSEILTQISELLIPRSMDRPFVNNAAAEAGPSSSNNHNDNTASYWMKFTGVDAFVYPADGAFWGERKQNMASRPVATAYAESMINIRMVTTDSRAQ
ncbi:hypothetical protein CEUSTIGMA_g11684.t1 [Chlamydomonas eustigma]|uniref:Uncharacterized protein n=1 Tax=Chlamydomonas eustigma TaxID=1157962 RepID=A0A250XMC9_9CHLO|nr:hypothetical protein CEUSTIGMA_g11684.t1 [Chlamydomonas eustigma]|eukprot:GAX84261.1 hypothetical protein CEUSTIGMA_g11684.t1 [Chlamydomonas eustigma]